MRIGCRGGLRPRETTLRRRRSPTPGCFRVIHPMVPLLPRLHRCGGVSGSSRSSSNGPRSRFSPLRRSVARSGQMEDGPSTLWTRSGYYALANTGLWPGGPPLSVGFAAEEHVAIDAHEPHLRFWIQQCNASQSHRLLLPTRLFSWSDLGAPPQWTLSTSSGKFEAAELVGDLTIWSFVSLLELQGFSLTGANGHALIGTACGSPGRVLGVTARSLRENLEKAEAIHLCRSEECPRGRL